MLPCRCRGGRYGCLHQPIGGQEYPDGPYAEQRCCSKQGNDIAGQGCGKDICCPDGNRIEAMAFIHSCLGVRCGMRASRAGWLMPTIPDVSAAAKRRCHGTINPARARMRSAVETMALAQKLATKSFRRSHLSATTPPTRAKTKSGAILQNVSNPR